MSFLKTFITCALLVAASLWLTACTGPAQLGLTQYQWNQMSPASQQRAINHYHEIQANLSQKSHAVVTQPTAHITNMVLNQQNNQSDPVVDLTITQAYAAFPAQFRPLQAIVPTHITLKPGSCSTTPIAALNGHGTTTLWLCYTDHMIGIDPSYYKLNQAWGTLFIDLNPLWNRGITYNHLYSSGFVHLSNASIYIKAQTPVDLTPKPVDITSLVTLDSQPPIAAPMQVQPLMSPSTTHA